MKNLSFFLSFLVLGASMAQAQDKKTMDRQAILDMCGCFEVTFKYTETFAPEIDYEKKLDYTAKAYELALPIIDKDNKISIQHLLVLNDTMVIKHWRQDWVYENQTLFHYDKDNNWTFAQLPDDQVKGQWTQLVYNVEDSPRYSGSSTWVHYDGKTYWENTGDSPLPRREYSRRDDFNVLVRGNRHEITPTGWIHEQDNDKVIREDGKEDVLLTQEKGYNVYTRLPDENCQVAAQWWEDHKEFWGVAVQAWDQVLDRKEDLTLLKEVDGKPLFMHFDKLEKENANKKEIVKIINSFMVDGKKDSNAGK